MSFYFETTLKNLPNSKNISPEPKNSQKITQNLDKNDKTSYYFKLIVNGDTVYHRVSFVVGRKG